MRAAPELCGDRLTEAHTWERGVVPRVGKLKRATLAREVESSTKQWHEQWMRTADANQQRIEMQLSGAAFSNSLQSPRYRSCMTPLVNVSNLQCPSVCFLCCLRLPRCVSTRTTGLSSRDRCAVVVRLAEWASERERKKLLRACGMYFVRPFLASLGLRTRPAPSLHSKTPQCNHLGEFAF